MFGARIYPANPGSPRCRDSLAWGNFGWRIIPMIAVGLGLAQASLRCGRLRCDQTHILAPHSQSHAFPRHGTAASTGSS